VEIREARSDDWLAVAALLAELGRPDVLAETDSDRHREAYEEYLARPDTVALVAEDAGRVVGFVDMEYRSRLNFSSPQAWIPDLIVTTRVRSRGAGKALLAACQERARTRGCFAVSLESANWRERAHAFYEREGMKNVSASFAKLLQEGEWPPPPREEG
jgi:ribosomal protein S18 acetylase RimI-like enzyme